ncbi:MAG: hypothetical protein HKP34_06075 [Nitrosopumilus sp.]|nr:hypothetical protein [Nitrosopumilus sp.]NNL37853.1 hypothetical protein [Nitrosopumilus sp.]
MGDNTILQWDPNSILKWSDFQAESNPALYEDSHSVIKYSFTWTVDSDKINDEIIFLIKDIRIFVDFHHLLSWARLSEVDDLLLKHEQGKFDLAELVKQENIKNIHDLFYNKPFPVRGQNEEQRKQFAKEDSGKMINTEIEKLTQIFDEKCLIYQSETNFGKNLEVQTKYNLIFNRLHL